MDRVRPGAPGPVPPRRRPVVAAPQDPSEWAAHRQARIAAAHKKREEYRNELTEEHTFQPRRIARAKRASHSQPPPSGGAGSPAPPARSAPDVRSVTASSAAAQPDAAGVARSPGSAHAAPKGSSARPSRLL
ncbi:unnamed protein product, partial [Prorocentrum cordatum]